MQKLRKFSKCTKIVINTAYYYYMISAPLWFLLQWWTSWLKPTWKGKSLFGLHFFIQLYHRGKPRQKLIKQGKNMEAKLIQGPWGNISFRLDPHGFLSLLSFGPQVSRGSTTYAGLGPTTSLSIQENISTDLSTGCDGGVHFPRGPKFMSSWQN